MAKATKVKQLAFEIKNKVGALAEISSMLSAARVNMKAICAYSMGKKGYFMLVTSNNTKAKRALAKLKIKAASEDVIAVEMTNQVGQLKKAANNLSEAGIDIEYMYGTVGTGKNAVCILKTANDNKAIKVLKQS